MSLTLCWRSAPISRCLLIRTLSTTSERRGDPWPLPHTPEHIASTGGGSPAARLRGPEALDVLRARLTYQSRKRGILETDLLLSTFARDHLQSMSRPQLEEYDKLLDEPDWDIYYWATGKKEVPSKWVDSGVLEKLKVHARNEGKVVRVMPPL